MIQVIPLQEVLELLQITDKEVMRILEEKSYMADERNSAIAVWQEMLRRRK